MNFRFFIALLVVFLGLSALVYAGVSGTKQSVVTVHELLESGSGRRNVRLGARVTEDPIDYRTNPDFLLQFSVRDIEQDKPEAAGSIPVEYHQMMPNTLQAGRDVILEGDFEDGRFVARSVLTQCPSKYEPPLPEG